MNAQDEEEFCVCMFWKVRMQQAGRRRIRRPISMLVREWLSEDRRQQLGYYSKCLNRELRTEDVNASQDYQSMPTELFDAILERVTPAIGIQDKKFHSVLSPGLTRRHLLTGDNYSSVFYAFRCSKAAICHMVQEFVFL